MSKRRTARSSLIPYPCFAVDEEIRRRIETKLIVAILSFDLN